MDYGRRKYVSPSTTVDGIGTDTKNNTFTASFMGEITDQYMTSIGQARNAAFKRPYIYKDYQSMMYLFDSPLRALTPPQPVMQTAPSAITIIPSTSAVDYYWYSLALSGNGQCILAGVDANVFSKSTLLFSTDSGNTWSEIHPTGASSGVCTVVSASDDFTILATLIGGGSGSNNSLLYVSSDSGVNWNDVTPPQSVSTWWQVVVSKDGSTIYALSNNYLLKSTDNGINWINITPISFSGIQPLGIGCSFTGSNLSIVIWLPYPYLEFKVYESSDYGSSWSSTHTMSGYDNISTYLNGDGSINFLYGLYSYIFPEVNRIYKSFNGGSLTTLKETVQYYIPKNLVSDSSGNNIVCFYVDAINTLRRLFFSANSGSTWNEITPPLLVQGWPTLSEAVSSIAINSSGNIIIMADYLGHLYMSQDNGTTWIKRK